MNQTKSATTKQIPVPIGASESKRSSSCTKTFYPSSKATQTNGQHSVCFAGVCSRMLSPQVPVISFLYSKFDPNNCYVPGALS